MGNEGGHGDGSTAPGVTPTVRPMTHQDARILAAEFDAMGWSKPLSLFERYLDEHEAGRRWAVVGEWRNRPVGYVTYVEEADDPDFREAGVPEVVDLNVLGGFQRRGVGAALLEAVEARAAERHDRIGLRVGLHPGYGPAQRLYVQRGYVPDGAGAVRDGRPVPEGASVPLDDDTTLRMVKKLD